MISKRVSSLLTTILIATSFVVFNVNAHSGHSHDDGAVNVMVSDAQVREFLPASKSTAGYLNLINHSDTAITLVKAEIDGLGRVEIHEHRHVDGMMKMQQVESLEIKAHSKIKFQPGSYHLMAFEPEEPLKEGQQRKLTLYFSDGNRIFTQATVVSLASQAAKKTEDTHSHSHH